MFKISKKKRAYARICRLPAGRQARQGEHSALGAAYRREPIAAQAARIAPIGAIARQACRIEPKAKQAGREGVLSPEAAKKPKPHNSDPMHAKAVAD